MSKLDSLFLNFKTQNSELITFGCSSLNLKPLHLTIENQKMAKIIDNRLIISEIKSQNFFLKIDGDVLIENIFKSNIKLYGTIDSLRIKNINDSNIEIMCLCNGTIYIENVDGGSLIIAGDQVRIHECANVDIYLFTRSGCILENCTSLRFHRNRNAAIQFGAKDDSYWNCIQDFGFNPKESFYLVDESS